MKQFQRFKCIKVSPDLKRFTEGQIYRRVLKLCDTITVKDDYGVEHVLDNRGVVIVNDNQPASNSFARFEPVEVR